MSDSRFPRQMIDDAIDRAVREMVHIDERPGLRRRVLARMGPRVPRSVSPWVRRSLGPRAAIPAAILAVFVIIGVGLWRSAPTLVQIAGGTPSAPSPSPTAPSSSAIFGPRRDLISAASLDRVARPGSSAVVPFVVDDVPLPLTPIVLQPLANVAEIRVAPIELQRIALPALSSVR